MTAERTMLLGLFIVFFASLTISTTTHAGSLCDCDLQWDGIIDAHDFALFAIHWGDDDCWSSSNWCGGADINHDHFVNYIDLAYLTTFCWLKVDDIKPTPNPMRWDPSLDGQNFDGKPREVYIGPNPTWDWGVTMRADPNTFDNTRFEFYFECTRPGYEAFSSGWRSFPGGPPYQYMVITGQQGFMMTWRVRARDKSINQNTTDWSTTVQVN